MDETTGLGMTIRSPFLSLAVRSGYMAAKNIKAPVHIYEATKSLKYSCCHLLQIFLCRYTQKATKIEIQRK